MITKSKYLEELEKINNLETSNDCDAKNVENENQVESTENIEKNNVDINDNLVLKISEKDRKIYFPYTKQEIEELLEKYPKVYNRPKDVIDQEFIIDLSLYNHYPSLERFREAYSLSRYKEMKGVLDSLKFAMSLMFRREINPVIIAAVKSEKQLENYIECLENNKLNEFKYFDIIFEVNPI